MHVFTEVSGIVLCSLNASRGDEEVEELGMKRSICVICPGMQVD